MQSRAKRPFCADCGSLDCHVVSVKEVAVVTQINGAKNAQERTYHVWLCGSCEFLRENPDAAKSTVPPGLPSTWRRSRGKPQRESLF